jgi:hypothetical protein
VIEDFLIQLKINELEFEQVTEELIWVKNYITQDELNEINEAIGQTTQKDWETHYMSSVSSFCMAKFWRDDVDNLVAEGKFEITQGWADKTWSIHNRGVSRSILNRLSLLLSKCDPSLVLSGLSTIQRLPPGTELKSHVDQNTDPSIRYATIIYINDDYGSGEIFFKNFNIDLKPKPGDLLFFPGNSEYEHGVRPVSDGPVRYVMVGFVKEIGFYDRNKY